MQVDGPGKTVIGIGLSLFLATLLLYVPVAGHEFLMLDDDSYVVNNRHVLDGLTVEGVVWAFTSRHASNWHPITWLSHMLDCELFGPKPGGHHVTSAVIHAINAVLLFWGLYLLTGAPWRSAFVAALFAFHPLRVESVAWVAERKDVLAGAFWWLAIIAYAWFARRPGWKRYLPVALVFALGLMAKPMLITLPFVLLLLDLWPLGRWRRPGRLILEKLPLLGLALLSGFVTLWAQGYGGSMASLQAVTPAMRAANAAISYVSYLWQTIRPTRLSFFYPHAVDAGMADTAAPRALAAILVLTVISYFVFRFRTGRPYLLVGWSWFLVTLVPVIGLVQVGMQGRADRYTYIPMVGVYIMVAWGAAELSGRWKRSRLIPSAGALALLATLAVVASLQLRHWSDSGSLAVHALRVTDGNYVAHNMLGRVFLENDRLEEAGEQFSRALEMEPGYAAAHLNMGQVLEKKEQLEPAITHYEEATRLLPDLAAAHSRLAGAYVKQGRLDLARARYEIATRLEPDNQILLEKLGGVCLRIGDLAAAQAHFNRVVELVPDYANGRYNLGIALKRQDRLDQAMEQLELALELDPDDAETLCAMGAIDLQRGELAEAAERFGASLDKDPELLEAHYNLGVTFIQMGDHARARSCFQRALAIQPDFAPARQGLVALDGLP